MTNASPAADAPAAHTPARPLPPGWCWVRLGEVCELRTTTINPQDFPDEIFSHYSIPAFDQNKTPVFEAGKNILSNKFLFDTNSILFSKLNPRISRVWLIDNDNGYQKICSTEFIVLYPNHQECSNDYLALVLQNPNLINELRLKVSAATKSRERLQPEYVLNALIPLPPLAEQRRIAALLSEQLAAVEQARAAAEARLEAARELPAAYLREIFESEEARSWPIIPLESAGNIGAGITLGRSFDGIETRRVPYLRVANVKDGYLALDDVYDIAVPESDIQKCRLQYGDLLLTEGGDPDKLGRGMFWEDQLPECIHQNHIFRVRFDLEHFSPAFLSAQIGSSYGKAYFLAHAKQTTGIATINQRVLSRFPLITPSLDVQQRIAASIDTYKTDIQQTTKAIQEQLDAINALPAALLRRAFAGEL